MDWCCFGTQALSWIDEHDGLAAWVQAIGSIAAIGAASIASWISIKESRRHLWRKERRLLQAIRLNIEEIWRPVDEDDNIFALAPEIDGTFKSFADARAEILDLIDNPELVAALQKFEAATRFCYLVCSKLSLTQFGGKDRAIEALIVRKKAAYADAASAYASLVKLVDRELRRLK